MKKNYFLLALILLTGFGLSAQESPFSLGVKAGINLSNTSMDMKDVAKKNPKASFVLGFTAEYNFVNNFALQSGLSLTTKGTKIKGESPIGLDESFAHPGREAKLSYNQIYLQLPIYLAYKIDISSKTKIVFHAGLYFGYGVGGKGKFEGYILYDDMILLDTYKENVFGDNALKKFDFGVGTGISAELDKLIVGFNYDLGLTDIGAKDAGTLFYNKKYKNRTASLTLGYKF